MSKPDTWTTLQLAEICKLRGGSAFKPALQGRGRGELPFIKVSDFNSPGNEACINGANNWVDAADSSAIQGLPFPAGATVFAKIGEALKQNRKRILVRPTYIDNNLMAAVGSPDVVLPEFLFQLFRTIDIAACDVGTAVPYVKASTLEKILVAVPPIKTQRRIASILGAYDDLIEVNRRRIAVLEGMARGLFEEWFIRFRFPGHEATSMEDTPNGPVPQGWSWEPLGSLIELIYGKALKADTRQHGDVAVIGSSGVVGLHDAALVPGPGIVVGRKGNVGSVIWSSVDFWPIDTTYYVNTKLPLPYIYQLLGRIPFQNTDAAVPGLNRDYALSRIVLATPGALVQRYGDFAAPIHEAVTGLELANAGLAASRDLLLPRLISGQLSVAQAKRELEVA